MDQEEKDLLAKVLQMNEIELRAALITIVRDGYHVNHDQALKNILKIRIDTAYNVIRRTGVRF